LVLDIDSSQTMITYTLNYANLQGGAPSASHIHIGQAGVNGGVSAFLCGGGTKPACPTPSGPVSGTILASDIVGPAGQGVAAGELSEVIAAIRAGVTYANVHTPSFPSGEIRGRIR
jgi:hypothetical protein